MKQAKYQYCVAPSPRLVMYLKQCMQNMNQLQNNYISGKSKPCCVPQARFALGDSGSLIRLVEGAAQHSALALV